jgi:predicted transglutaminase-like cysteine proteinase
MQKVAWSSLSLHMAAVAVLAVSISLTVAHALAEPLPALPAVSTSLTGDGETQPTRAWAKFCDQTPAECEVDPSQPEIIALTPRTWGAILATNIRVNSTITPMTDQEHWGEEDRWDYPDDGRGDCEDIQLLKRKQLVEEGLPRRALRMTVVLDEAGAGHAVLMVRTDRGDLILDNKSDIVLPWKQTGYIFIKREGSDGAAWVGLEEQGVSITTAAQ